MATYLIEELKENEKLFEEFRRKLPGDWVKHCRCESVDDFLEEFDRKNTSRETYPMTNSFCKGDYADEIKIHNFINGDATIEEFAKVEIGTNKFIELYGYTTFTDWNVDYERYDNKSFGKYYKIVIE